MQTSAEKYLAPLVLIAATSVPSWYEAPFGAFGLSAEHILLIIYFLFISVRGKTRIELEFVIVALFATATSIVGLTMVHISNAHLGSFVVLSLMFPLFIKYFEKVKVPDRIVIIAFALILLQCIFFSHESLGFEEEWDYLVIPGFGVVPRLAILGYVSNSLGLMLYPFFIYFLYKSHECDSGKQYYYFLTSLTLALIIFTFSRSAIVLILVSVFLMFDKKISIGFLLLGILLVAFNRSSEIDLLDYTFLRGGALTENSRVQVWIYALSNWSGFDILVGRGMQKPALDNTYLSLITGAGVLGMIVLVLYIFTIGRWLIKKKKIISNEKFIALALIVVGIIISANTYDIFSQRKILFGSAVIIGALLSKHARNLHL